MGLADIRLEHRAADHADDRREIITAFNYDLGDFVAKQVKIATAVDGARPRVLGGHFHDYRELFFLIQGEAYWALEDIATKEQVRHRMVRHDRLFIPAHVAHEAVLSKDAVLLGATEEQYVQGGTNDKPYRLRARLIEQ